MSVSDFKKAQELKERRREEARRQRPRYSQSEIENFGRVNTALLVITAIMLAYGLIMLFSASIYQGYAEWGDPLYFVRRQAKINFIGLLFLFFVTYARPIRFYNRIGLAAIVYVLSILLLAAVILRGTEGVYGATRWLTIGPIQFQPSEACKVSCIYCLSAWFPYVRSWQAREKDKAEDPRKFRAAEGRRFIVYPVLLIGFMIFLIVIQPHLSGAIIVFTISATIFLLARIPWRIWANGLLQLLPLLLVALLLLALFFPLVDSEHRSITVYLGEKFAHVTQRISTFRDPDSATDDQLHQVLQSRYALGSGGFFGKGLGMGQQKSGFLPMVYNDYILPSIGEELGFLGTLSVILLFMAFFLVGTSISLNANSFFAASMSWGCTFLITLQALLNIAVAAEVIPATGISLPFFSYGGTASVFFLIAIGFILCVSRTGQRIDPELRRILDERHEILEEGKANPS